MGRYRVSADIGGTFTDLVFYDKLTGAYEQGKTLTTPRNLSDAIMKGISEKIDDYGEIDFFVHGTTAGLNAFLERKGARVALMTTKGFRDVYEIGRGNRKDMYSLSFKKPTPLISRQDIFEVDERILYDGTVQKALVEESVAEAVREIRRKGYESVAVCLINAYVNPVHEIEMKKIIQKSLPEISISLSNKVAREWREYERTSTTVINAYIAPIVEKYLKLLEDRISRKGFKEIVHVMQSGGGVITSSVAKEIPIQTLLSGPVGGAVGNSCFSETVKYGNFIGVDMGGTSYDVSMIIDGKPDVSMETNLEGFPVLTPMINIHTIGAGGGSIAWIEAGGLRVGPVSAGSEPGPACYGRGGKKPTITDANVVLGRIDPEGFLGGKMVLEKNAAAEAVKGIADELKLTVEETAEGICKIADSKMAEAIRQLTIRKGIDPREFVLVPFGGAGPMHACLTAEELGIETVMVPEMPGIFSAWGMLQCDIRQDAVRTLKSTINKDLIESIRQKYHEMQDEVLLMLKQQNIGEEQSEYQRIADVRYLGQEYTVRVQLEPGILTENSLNKLCRDFHEQHYKIYGHSNPGGEVEIVNIRLVGIGRLEQIPEKKAEKLVNTKPRCRKTGTAIFYGKEFETRVYLRDNLKPGQKFDGPAIIEEFTCTTVVPPGYRVGIDGYRNIIIAKIK